MSDSLTHATVSADGMAPHPGARITQGTKRDPLIRQKLGGLGYEY